MKSLAAHRVTVGRTWKHGRLDLKDELHQELSDSREVMLARTEGLSEYDMRRPMTPTGTNLLGLINHLAGVE